MYGNDAQLKLIQRISDLEAQHQRLLLQLPDAQQSHYWQRHREASTEQGAEKWVFPEVINDEQQYRERHKDDA